jgi:hypothetical protein
VLATLLAFAPAAFAAPPLTQKVGSEMWTYASGAMGATSQDIETTAAYYGLRAVTLFQYGRRPCALGAEEAPLRAPGMVWLDTLRACEPTGGQEWKRADVGEGRFVTAIATCRSKRDHAIHGVALWSAALGPNGELVSAKYPAAFQFRDCTDWQAKRECPAGLVATGVRVFWSDAERGVEGLSLRCHQLEAATVKVARR